MDGRAALIRAVELLVLVLVVALVGGQLLGQPVLLSYVETGSMAPTLQPGDGFIAIPAAVAGPIESGDVIVFDADQLHGGGLVTHRVVGESDAGFITKGDANPFTDQDGREPPVQRAQIVAEALQIGGNVVVIPGLGAGVLLIGDTLGGLQQQLAVLFNTRSLLGTQGLAYLLFGLGMLAYGVSLLAERRDGRGRDRQTDRNVETLDATLVVGGLTLVLVVVVTLSMVAAGGTHSFEIISADTDAPGHRVIKAGTNETVSYTVPSNGILPVVVYLEPGSEGIDVTPRELYVPSNDRGNATVTLSAPTENGRYLRYLTEHRYLAVLPQGTIRSLYHVHPWLPILVIDALFGLGFAGFGSALIGTGTRRFRTGRDRTLQERLRRWLR